MEEEIIIEKLKKAIERATKNVIMINSFYSYIPFTSTEGELEPGYIEQYEALVKAMIYHEMINDGIPMVDIAMEEPIGNKIQRRKRFDFYINNVISDGKAKEFFIEVKTFVIYSGQKKEPDIRRKMEENDIRGIVGKDGEGTIYSDIKKLNTAVKESKKKAIMIIVDQSQYIGGIDHINIIIDELKKLLKKEKFSNEILFAIADNSRTAIMSAEEIKVHKE